MITKISEYKKHLERIEHEGGNYVVKTEKGDRVLGKQHESLEYKDIFGKQHTHDEVILKDVRDNLMQILMDTRGVSEKAFNQLDLLSAEVKSFFDQHPEILETANKFYHEGKRLQLYAEQLYDQYFKHVTTESYLGTKDDLDTMNNYQQHKMSLDNNDDEVDRPIKNKEQIKLATKPIPLKIYPGFTRIFDADFDPNPKYSFINTVIRAHDTVYCMMIPDIKVKSQKYDKMLQGVAIVYGHMAATMDYDEMYFIHIYTRGNLSQTFQSDITSLSEMYYYLDNILAELEDVRSGKMICLQPEIMTDGHVYLK